MHIYHHLFKSAVDAMAFIAQEILRWHPAGYGTYFNEPTRQPDGQWLVTGSRSNSCD